MTRQQMAASIGIVWCVVSLAGARQQSPDPAQWVPADAVAYLGIADPAALLKRFEKTAARPILNKVSQLGGPLKQFAQLGDELRRRLSALLGLKPNELATPRGPIALYLTPSPDAPADTHFVLIFGIDDNEDNRARYAAALDRLRGLDRDHKATQRDAWTIDTLRRRSAQRSPAAAAIRTDEDVNPFGLDAAAFGDRSSEQVGQWFSPEAMPDTIAMCHAGARIIISDSTRAVESALSLSDVGRSLASGNDYQALLRHFESPGPLRVIVHLPHMLGLPATDGGIDSDALNAWGLAGLGTLLGHAELAGDDFDLRAEVVLLSKGQPAAAAKLLRMDNRPVRPPPWVSADTQAFASLNLDVLKSIDGLLEIFRRKNPRDAAMLRLMLEAMPQANGKTLNVREDVLKKLRPPLTLSASIANPYGLDATRLLVSIGWPGADLEHSALAGRFVLRESQGVQLYESADIGLSVAASAETVFVGPSSAVVRAVRPPVSSLANHVDFKRAAALVPPDGWLLAYADGRNLFDGLLALLEQRERSLTTVMTSGADAVAIAAAEQFAKRFGNANPAKIREVVRHFAPFIITCRTESDGLRLTLAVLKSKSN